MKILLFIERFGPALIGFIVFTVLISNRSDVVSVFLENKWSMSGLYSAVFGWASIQTGFIFGVFGFVAGSSDGFVRDARETRSMKLFISYTKRAMMSAFVLSVVTMPLIVTDLKLSEVGSIAYNAICLWFSVFIWAFCAFARVAYIFGIIVRIPNRAT